MNSKIANMPKVLLQCSLIAALLLMVSCNDTALFSFMNYDNEIINLNLPLEQGHFYHNNGITLMRLHFYQKITNHIEDNYADISIYLVLDESNSTSSLEGFYVDRMRIANLRVKHFDIHFENDLARIVGAFNAEEFDFKGKRPLSKKIIVDFDDLYLKEVRSREELDKIINNATVLNYLNKHLHSWSQ